MALVGIVFGVAHQPAVSAERALATLLPRVTYDRPDDVTGSQVHAMYVLPNDGTDRHLDSNGTIEGSVAAFQAWLRGQSSGRSLRIDTYQGSMDITFFRLSRTDAEIATYGEFVRDQIEVELKTEGFNAPDRIYAVYYDGSSTFSCGGGAWPPDLPGNVAAVYLLGEPLNAPACATNEFATAAGPPRYWEFSMPHEILHTLGFVAPCAPHHHRRGHVFDATRDLMWAGDSPWDIEHMVLDSGNDDYFRHSIPGCPDLQDSPFLAPAPTPPQQVVPTTPTSPVAPVPAQPEPQRQSKWVTLKARPRTVERGERTKLTAIVSPCPGHEGDAVEFYRGSNRIAEKPSNAACVAVLKVRMRKTATFTARLPQQDDEYLAGVSNPIKVRVLML